MFLLQSIFAVTEVDVTNSLILYESYSMIEITARYFEIFMIRSMFDTVGGTQTDFSNERLRRNLLVTTVLANGICSNLFQMSKSKILKMYLKMVEYVSNGPVHD